MVRARLFARLRELAGTGLEQIDGAETIADVYAALRRQHPALPQDPGQMRVVRNEELAAWTAPVFDGDEVAFIPPVSGGAQSVARVLEVGPDPIDGRRLEAAVAHGGAGAICTFTGVVRDTSRGEEVTHLEYEAYESMALRMLGRLADELGEQWPEIRVAIAHRVGRLEIGEASVVVSVSAPHRQQAIAACWRGIDRLKESVPIWKKEFARSGASWIEGPEAAPAPNRP